MRLGFYFALKIQQFDQAHKQCQARQLAQNMLASAATNTSMHLSLNPTKCIPYNFCSVAPSAMCITFYLFLIFFPARTMQACPNNISIFRNFDHFLLACPNTYLSTDFSKTMQLTQRCHLWIASDLIYMGKLLPRQTNSRILRNLRFGDRFTPIFDKHIEIKLPLRLYYSRA